MSRHRLGLFFVLFMLLPSRAWSAMDLIMFEQKGCMYCARWNAEIAPEYAKTAEGQAAPLTRLDIRDPLPATMSLIRPASFTPTFILLVGGVEAGRIEGYPGEDFFWGLLAGLIKKAAGDPPK